MKFTPRGVCLLAAVALAILKVAGVISWPWLVVGIALLGWAYPYLIVLASVVGYLALGLCAALLTLGLGLAQMIPSMLEERKRKKARAAALEAGAPRGAWD